MILNFTNHPQELWSRERMEMTVSSFGSVVDLPFPAVPADATEEDIAELSRIWTEKICAMKPDAVICQGEMTLAFSVARNLLRLGFPVLAAASDRVTEEEKTEDGNSRKTALFEFVQFREYRLSGEIR